MDFNRSNIKQILIRVVKGTTARDAIITALGISKAADIPLDIIINSRTVPVTPQDNEENLYAEYEKQWNARYIKDIHNF